MFLENQYSRASNLRRPTRPRGYHFLRLGNIDQLRIVQPNKIYSRVQELTLQDNSQDNSGGLGCHITQCPAYLQGSTGGCDGYLRRSYLDGTPWRSCPYTVFYTTLAPNTTSNMRNRCPEEYESIESLSIRCRAVSPFAAVALHEPI